MQEKEHFMKLSDRQFHKMRFSYKIFYVIFY